MNKRSGTSKDAADKLVRGIKRKTRKHYSAEEKIRIVLAGLRGEESIAALCRREGIAESLYYSWSKEFLEAGKNRLAGDTARQATSPEVKELRSESAALKEVVAELTLENRLLKKSMPPLAVCAQTAAGQRGMGNTRNEVPRIGEVGDHSHGRSFTPADPPDAGHDRHSSYDLLPLV